MSEVLLSICIPTYNRGSILEQTLTKIVADPDFDSRCEIIICDNCSNDQTERIGRAFSQKYSNILYHRNEVNLYDQNFSLALSKGSGLYLKLLNDTVTLNDGKLGFLLETISNEKKDMDPIFFYQNIPFLNSDRVINIFDLNDFISSVSYMQTWISNFGVWKTVFDSLEEKNRFSSLKLMQCDWSMRIVTARQKGTIYFSDFYKVAELTAKGGYNVFQVFGINYLFLFQEYLGSMKLNPKVYKIEKFRLFRYFLIGLYRNTIIENNKAYLFDTAGAKRILAINYKHHFYYYFGLVFFFFSRIFIRSRQLFSKNL